MIHRYGFVLKNFYALTHISAERDKERAAGGLAGADDDWLFDGRPCEDFHGGLPADLGGGTCASLEEATDGAPRNTDLRGGGALP